MSAVAAQPLAGAYTADQVHSQFAFGVSYVVSTFRGTFSDVAATLTVGPDGAALEGTAEVESISVRTPEQFREHILSPEFFDAAAHPQIAFRSTRVELADDGRATVDGDLTIRGTTLPVHATGSWTPETEHFCTPKAGLKLEATIDRAAYGFGWNADLPSGAKALSNDVTLTIDLTLDRQA